MNSYRPTAKTKPEMATSESDTPNKRVSINQLAGSRVRFPWRPLTGIVILTFGLCVWSAIAVLHTHNLDAAVQQRQLRLHELRDAILVLDEVLTLSVHLSAATGDPQWEDHYQRFKPELDAAIKETTRLEPNRFIVQIAAQTDAVNLKSVEMERRVFEWVRQGQPDQARTILTGEDYRRQKQAYRNGMLGFMAQLADHLKAAQTLENQAARIAVLGSVAGLASTLWLWMVAIRHLRHWRRALVRAMAYRRRAEAALFHIQKQMKEQQRSLTTALSVEIAAHQRAEEARRKKDGQGQVLCDAPGMASSCWR